MEQECSDCMQEVVRGVATNARGSYVLSSESCCNLVPRHSVGTQDHRRRIL